MEPSLFLSVKLIYLGNHLEDKKGSNVERLKIKKQVNRNEFS